MTLLDKFYLYILITQLFHSMEELSTGFHKKWYLSTLSFKTFLLFEILFSSFWLYLLINTNFPNRIIFQKFFILLMFANGVQHLVWWGSVKKYVPGLITAFIHIGLFLNYYFK